METQEKLIKQIRNAGVTSEIVGLLSLIGSIFIGFILSKAGNISPALLLLIVPNAVIGLIFVILGGKIRKSDPISSRNKLWVIAILSGIIVISNFLSSSHGSALLPIFVFGSSLIALNAIKKLMGRQVPINTLNQMPMSGSGKLKDIFKMVVIAIVVIGIFIGIVYVKVTFLK